MKYKLTILALFIAVPSITWASVNFLDTDPVYVVAKAEREDIPAPVIRNYRLQWNQELGRFDLLPGNTRRPITLEESMTPQPIEPQQNEPIYYGDDFSV